MWDGENRLIEIVTKRVDDQYQPGDKRLRFRYDYMSRRVEKVFSVYKATGWSERKRQRYVYDGWNVILVLDGGNNVKTSYTWGLDLSGSLQGAGGVGGLLAEFKMNGQYPEAHWFTCDGNGNVAQVLRNYSTVVTVAAHYEYDPYGNTIASPGTYADANPFRFSTKWLDSELASWTAHGAIGISGLYYYGYRYYSPRLGRWVNRDPIEERGGLNLVAFLSNAPIMKIDLLGMLCCNKCNPTTATKRVTGFAVALGPAVHGFSNWTKAAAEGVVGGARLIGDFEEKGGYVRDVLTNLKNGIGVLASDLAQSIPDFFYGKIQDIYIDAIIGIANNWSNILAAEEGVKIWVKVDFEKCDKEWCLFVMRRYNWLKDDLKHECSASKGPYEIGFPYGDTRSIAKAIPGCIKEALNKIK